MSTYFVGIDISKYKHDCCIINAADQSIVAKFTINNDKDGFNKLLTSLQSLSTPEDIMILYNNSWHTVHKDIKYKQVNQGGATWQDHNVVTIMNLGCRL